MLLLSLQYMSNVDSWCKACGEVDLPSELQDLEDAIHHHQGLYEHITAAYSEASSHTRWSWSAVQRAGLALVAFIFPIHIEFKTFSNLR